MGRLDCSFNTFPHLKKALALYNATRGVKPWWLLPTRDKLQANGLLDDSERWAVKSDQLYISNWSGQLYIHFEGSQPALSD